MCVLAQTIRTHEEKYASSITDVTQPPPLGPNSHDSISWCHLAGRERQCVGVKDSESQRRGEDQTVANNLIARRDGCSSSLSSTFLLILSSLIYFYPVIPLSSPLNSSTAWIKSEKCCSRATLFFHSLVSLYVCNCIFVYF